MENLPGLGVRGWLEGKEVLVGSLKMFETLNVELGNVIRTVASDFETAGKTVMIISYDGSAIGVIGLEDAPRPQTTKLIQALKNLGVRHVIMLTGDNPAVAKIVADRVGIQEYHASLLPEQKLELIRKLDDKYGGVAMIGDGVNDAPALAATAVGIAMGDIGSGVALETADVVLLGGNLDKLPFVMGLARESQRIVKQNLAVALGVIGLLIVAILFVKVPIGIAVTLHEGSTVLVALNALRLLAYKQR
jgi:Cd2+/Zn2+-exporting ATPase